MQIAPSTALQMIDIATRAVLIGYGTGESFESPDIEPLQIIGELNFKPPRDAPCGERHRTERDSEQHGEEFERE